MRGDVTAQPEELREQCARSENYTLEAFLGDLFFRQLVDPAFVCFLFVYLFIYQC